MSKTLTKESVGPALEKMKDHLICEYEIAISLVFSYCCLMVICRVNLSFAILFITSYFLFS